MLLANLHGLNVALERSVSKEEGEEFCRQNHIELFHEVEGREGLNVVTALEQLSNFMADRHSQLRNEAINRKDDRVKSVNIAELESEAKNNVDKY